MTSLEDLTGIEFGNIEDNENNNEKSKNHRQKTKSRISTYKYSNKGKSSLYESILIDALPRFINYNSSRDKLEIVESVEEGTRKLEPPHEEEYPYDPYEFQNTNELNHYLQRAKIETVDSLYKKIKSVVRNYNDVDEETIILLSADILGSYFQDRFSTVHYLIIVGDNGTGKSAFGDTFESLGYRAVNMTDATAATWFRVLGQIEFGQVTIIADEAEKIDESSEVMSILKTGYQPKGKVPRMDNDIKREQFFYPFCFKIIISEKSPRESHAKGLLDRSFKIKTYRGLPQYDIKEIRNPQGNPIRIQLLEEIIDLRKLMLIYRLVHNKDALPEIDIGLIGRDKELCKPTLQLFFNTKSQPEVEKTLQSFINTKNQRKGQTIEALIYPVIENLVSQFGETISSSNIWQAIANSLEGGLDENNPNVFHSSDHGNLYRSSIMRIISDKFGAEIRHNRVGNTLTFNSEYLIKIGRIYDNKTGIQTKLVVNEGDTDKGDSCDSCDALLGNILEPDSFTKDEIQAGFMPGNKTVNAQPLLQSESHGSHESPITKHGYCGCYYCPESFDLENDYQKHVLKKHPKKLCYPNKAYIEMYDLTPQGKSWEK